MLEGGVNATTITSLPIFLLVILVVLVFMGLKLRWFRARMNIGSSSRNSEVTPLSGFYRTLARDEFRMTSQSVAYQNERSTISSQHKPPTAIHSGSQGTSMGLQTNGKARSVDNLVSEIKQSENKMNGYARPLLSGGINPLINRPLSTSSNEATSQTHSFSSNSLINQSVHSKSTSHINQVANSISVPQQAVQPKTKRPAPRGILQKGKAPPPPPLPEPSKNSNVGSEKFTLEDDYEEFET